MQNQRLFSIVVAAAFLEIAIAHPAHSEVASNCESIREVPLAQTVPAENSTLTRQNRGVGLTLES